MNYDKFFLQLKRTSSRIDKVDLIKTLDHDQVSMLKKIVRAALDTSINYYISDIDLKPIQNFQGVLSLSEAIDRLTVLSSRQLTGNAAKGYLVSLVSQLTVEDALVIQRILKGSLDCGVNASTFNKIWPGLIYEHPYQRCSSFSAANLANIELPCISQVKEDGLYLDVMVEETGVTYMTRSGQLVNQYGSYSKNNRLMQYAAGYVLMGEAMVIGDDGEYLPRKEGNGYLNSDKVDPDKVVIVCWDAVPIQHWLDKQSNIPYNIRLGGLSNMISKVANFALIDTVLCHSMDALFDHFKANVAAGKEGSVVKNLNGFWADGTSKDQVKLKIEFECDLEIVSIKEGEGKHKGKLGSVECKTSDGLLVVWAGGGYSDKQREDMFRLRYMLAGKIMTVRANDVIYTDKGVSLFLPRFVELRHDKTEADTLDRVVEQKDAAIDSLRQIKGL
jgi:DNA ligase-1